MSKMKLPVGAISLFLIFLLATMPMDAPDAPKSQLPKIVATTTLLADLATNIGDGLYEVDCLMGPGIDPHQYQASAGDLLKLQRADIILCHGLSLEGKMGKALAALRSSGKTVIYLGDGIPHAQLLSAADDESLPDPHIWFDVPLWQEAAAYLTEQLERVDRAHAEHLRRNCDAYTAQLFQLHQYIEQSVARLPQERRVLITAHDAFRYFGRRYGLEVVGLQGIGTNVEASIADIGALADDIAAWQVPSIFVETSVSPKAIEALRSAVHARGCDVQIGGELFADALGDTPSGAQTYILMCRRNIDTIVLGLMGGAQ